MGKWADRLAEKISHPPTPPLSKLPKGGVEGASDSFDSGVLGGCANFHAPAAHDPAPAHEAPQAPAPTPARRCENCTHRLRAGTCAVPEQAGLIPVGDGFGIFWPPAGHAATCPAWCSKAPAATATRPYRLSQAQADAAHAEPWDDGAIARFRARAADIQRRGVGEDDAEDLAELLHLRDVSGDRRRLCVECRHLLGSAATGWRCSNHRLAGMPVALAGDLVVSLAQCRGYGQPWTPTTER